MQFDTYLQRLGLTLPLPATVETLRRMHVAHLAAFPFHNVEIQRGGVVSVDLERIEQKFFAPEGGGYCFEQNTLFRAALLELGFNVTTLLARVGEHALTHMLLRIDVEGRAWIADVGFGGETLLEPMPLEPGLVQQGDLAFSLRREGIEWTLTLHCGGGESEEMYRFHDVPFSAADVEMANYFTTTFPASIFRHTLTIQRVTPEQRLILRPKGITVYRDGGRIVTPIEPAQLRHFARELFGFELGEGPLLFETLLDAGRASDLRHDTVEASPSPRV